MRKPRSHKKDDEIMGLFLRQWAEMDGDSGAAGKRLQNAIRAMSGYGLSETASVDAINDAAEWLRLATLSADKAANWPENGR